MKLTLLIPSAAWVVYFFMIVYVLARKRTNPITIHYSIYIGNLAIWVGILFYIWSPVDDSIRILLIKLTSLFWLPAGFLFMNFIYAFLGKKRDAIFYILLSVTYITAVIGMVSELIFLNVSVEYPWGYFFKEGPYHTPVMILIITLPVIYSVVLMLRDLPKIKHTIRYQQTWYIAVGSVISMLIGVITDIIIPKIFHYSEFIRLGFASYIIQSFFIFIAIDKYELLSLKVDQVVHYIFSSIKDGVILLNQDKSIAAINNGAQYLFKYDKKHITIAFIENHIENYTFNIEYFGFETTLREFKGTKKNVLINQSNIIQGNKIIGKLLFISDITLLKNIQDQKEKQEKIQTIQQMAGSIAHEFSQPLTVIQMIVDTLPLCPSDEINKKTEVLRKNVKRLSEIVHKAQNISDIVLRDYVDDEKIVDIHSSSDIKSSQ